MSLSENLKTIRQTCYLSQEAFAKELGVSFATVNRWEVGKTRPSYKTMKSIADFCKKNNIVLEITDKSESMRSEEV